MEEKTLQEGSKIEIIDHRINGNRHTYYSIMTRIIDESTFDAQAPLEKGIVIALEMGREYECYFITIYGLFRCKVRLESRSIEGDLHFLRFKVLTTIAKHQRRDFFRMDTMIPFRYYNSLINQWKEATTQNISGNGIKCITSENLSKGTRVMCELNLEIEKKVYTVTNLAEVIETIEDDSVAERRFETRLAFIDIPTPKQDIIIKYIYDEQRKRLKKEGR